jgi:hypothetical protein
VPEYLGLVAICSNTVVSLLEVQAVSCARRVVVSCEGTFHLELMDAIWDRQSKLICCLWVLVHWNMWLLVSVGLLQDGHVGEVELLMQSRDSLIGSHSLICRGGFFD